MPVSSYDEVVQTLRGDSANQWTRTEIGEILAETYREEKKVSLKGFDNAVSRTDYFEKIEGKTVQYKLSQSGIMRADRLIKEEKDKQKIDKVLEDFIETHYLKEIGLARKDEEEYLKIDYNKLCLGAYDFSIKLLEKPDESLRKLNQTIRNHRFCEDSENPPIASITNVGEVLQVEEIKTRHINKFVQVEGRITTQSIARTKVLTAAFKCQRCDDITYMEQEMERFVEPFECQNDICGRKGPFKLLPEPESVTADGQVITLTSLKGQVSIDVRLLGSSCEPPWVRDGKVVRVCGIVRSYQTISRTGTKSNNFDWMVDMNSIELAEDSNTEPPTDEEKKMFDEWAKNPEDLRNRLLGSVAPNIYGSVLEKDICSLTLFSDWEWNNDPEDVIEHSSIHVLLIGDPGVGKSQIAKDTVHLAPKAKFGQIIQMSRGGLSTVASEGKNGWEIKPGWFSGVDQGLGVLDEIDKVKEKSDLNCLNSVLLDQYQTVSKAGLNDMKFMTRAALILTANPKAGHFEEGDIIPQLDLDSHLFQRLDFILVKRDVADPETDRIVAKYINSIHSKKGMNRETIERPISAKQFRKYVLHARSKPVPEFGEGTQEIIEEYYLKMRSQASEYPVIGARQMNNINRVARAVARRECSTVITKEHVQYAIELSRAALATLNADDDYSVFNTGRTYSQVEKVRKIKTVMSDVCRGEKYATVETIAFQSGLSKVDVEHTIILMQRNGETYKVERGYRLV